jgi:sugar phosphate isomerase/epimerase
MMDAMSRRSLLRAGAIGAAASGVLGTSGLMRQANAEPRPGGTGGEIKLGVASYSFHQFDRGHVIDFMKQLNVQYLNAKDAKDHLPMAPPEATDAAVAAYKAAGIELTGAGVIYFPQADEADVRQKFEYAKRAGVSLIVGSPTHEALPMVERFAKQYDMRVAIHNHGPEDKEWPSPLDILKEIKTMDARIGLCIDVGHSARAFAGSGTDVVRSIHTAGSRVFDVHMKDLADMKVKESQVAVGDGKMPVREIFEALLAISYKGYVDLEYEIHDDDPLPGMIKSFAYMRGVLAGMGR